MTAKDFQRSMSQLMKICFAIPEKILHCVTVLEMILRKTQWPSFRMAEKRELGLAVPLLALVLPETTDSCPEIG